jgi:hypothetical protein
LKLKEREGCKKRIVRLCVGVCVIFPSCVVGNSTYLDNAGGACPAEGEMRDSDFFYGYRGAFGKVTDRFQNQILEGEEKVRMRQYCPNRPAVLCDMLLIEKGELRTCCGQDVDYY